MTLCLTVLACAGPGGRDPWPAAGTASGAVAAGKPAPPVRLALAFRPESPRRGEEVDLELTLHALADLPRVRVKLRLPPEVKLVGGSDAWEAPLTADSRHRLTFRVLLAGRGGFSLGASAEVLEGSYTGQMAGAVLFVDATTEAVRWSPDPL